MSYLSPSLIKPGTCLLSVIFFIQKPQNNTIISLLIIIVITEYQTGTDFKQ